MLLYHIILLALIQGITEFLPISSSGHLGLFHCFMDQCETWDQANVVMDIAVHVGTLLAVLLYFRADFLKMAVGAKHIASGNPSSENSKLLLFVILSSIPVICLGVVFNYLQPDWLKTLYVIAWMTLIFGIVLWWADSKNNGTRTITEMTYKDALFIGLAQMLALIPGVSRSGITMTASRFLGYSRTESAHYSMLLAIVAISGAGILIGCDVLREGDVKLGMDVVIGIVLSFASSWLALLLMMKFLAKFSFRPFAIYRIILGLLLLGLLYSGTISA